MMMFPYKYPLCIQLPPIDDLKAGNTKRLFEFLQKMGFYGVELNLLDFEAIAPEELVSYLAEFDLKVTMIASGGYAKKCGLSLSTGNEEIRMKTVAQVTKMLHYAEKLQAGVICGFIKGNSEGQKNICIQQMEKSLAQLEQNGALEDAKLYLEATNHYEALLVNTMEEGNRFFQLADAKIAVLPDTYHMNIEEKTWRRHLVKYRNIYKNLHISDNNRYYPGFGSLAFERILRILDAFGYEGTISIEGRNMGTLEEDIRHSCNYLRSVAEIA